jgi:hypothetical protein
VADSIDERVRGMHKGQTLKNHVLLGLDRSLSMTVELDPRTDLIVLQEQ